MSVFIAIIDIIDIISQSIFNIPTQVDSTTPPVAELGPLVKSH